VDPRRAAKSEQYATPGANTRVSGDHPLANDNHGALRRSCAGSAHPAHHSPARPHHTTL